LNLACSIANTPFFDFLGLWRTFGINKDSLGFWNVKILPCTSLYFLVLPYTSLSFCVLLCTQPANDSNPKTKKQPKKSFPENNRTHHFFLHTSAKTSNANAIRTVTKA